MAIYAVTYYYTDDPDGRDTHRAAHRAYMASLGERGANVVSGPFGAGERPGALFLVRGADRDEVVAAFAQDPFQVNGLVETVSVVEWIPMSGELAPRF